MTRRFNVESLSAHQAAKLALALWSRSLERGEPLTPAAVRKADRKQALLLHWWAAGHDPRRHVLACYSCGGVGHRGHTCSHCRGTGRRP